MFNLRDYQQKVITDCRNAYLHGFRAPLVVVPTGGGKTIIFSHMAASAASKNRKTLILVHRIELLRQTAQKLRAFGVRVGLISPKYGPDPFAPVQIAMVQTMVKRLEKYPYFDFIITDEAHHAISPTYMKVITNYPSAYQLGVTATPIRGDGKGLGQSAGGPYDYLVVGPTVQQLIDLGFLVEPIVYAPTTLSMEGVKRTMGDFNKRQAGELIGKSKIIGDAVDHYTDHCAHQPAVAFCINVAEAEKTAQQFRDRGYKSYHVHGGMDDRDRERILNGLGDGTVEVVSSCDVISEGTDIPAIMCGILLRPTQSTGLYLQQVGRTLRPMPDKNHAIILDHVGNWERHGLPQWEREWTLEGEKEKRKRGKKKGDEAPPVHQCESCYTVFPSMKSQCPSCGKVREIKRREIEQIEGELSQVTDAQQAAAKRDYQRRRGAAKSLNDLREFARRNGYKPGWAEHVYLARKKKKAKKLNERIDGLKAKLQTVNGDQLAAEKIKIKIAELSGEVAQLQV